MNNKKAMYRDFIQSEADAPVFIKDWWLDTVCGRDNWDVALVEKGGKIVAALPYYTRKTLFLTFLSMPPLTKTLGVYLTYPPKQKYQKRLSWEKELMQQLISQLPRRVSFGISVLGDR